MTDTPLSFLATTEGSCFPDLNLISPLANLEYEQFYDTVRGWVLYHKANIGEKRRYRFEAESRDGEWELAVTSGDADNKNYFFDRDGADPLRPIKGMPEKHRKDLRAYICRICDRLRDRVLDDEALLREAIEVAGMELHAVPDRPEVKIATANGWTITERFTILLGRHFVEARRSGN